MNLPSLVPSDSPALRTLCRPVRPDEYAELFDPKFLYRVDKFRKQLGGIGLAAPQLGDCRQWFVWGRSSRDHCELVVNPTILFRAGATERHPERCLSFPGRAEAIDRSVEIEVEYRDSPNAICRRRLHYWSARVFLHEFDHLQGICIVPEPPSLNNPQFIPDCSPKGAYDAQPR